MADVTNVPEELSSHDIVRNFLNEPGEEEAPAAPEPEGNLSLSMKDREKVEEKQKGAKEKESPKLPKKVLPDMGNVSDLVPDAPMGILLLLIFLILLAIVPVSGSNESRLSLLWGAITGRVRFGGIGTTQNQTAGNSTVTTVEQAAGYTGFLINPVTTVVTGLEGGFGR